MFIEFFDDYKRLEADGFVFNVPTGLETSDAVFEAYAKGFSAPGNYFGSNWDAFNDSFRYLEWINEYKIIIVHQQLPKLSDKLVKTYLEILVDACALWNNRGKSPRVEVFGTYGPHHMRVLFPANCKSSVLSALNND